MIESSYVKPLEMTLNGSEALVEYMLGRPYIFVATQPVKQGTMVKFVAFSDDERRWFENTSEWKKCFNQKK